TESIVDAAALAALTRPERVILSLDFKGDAFLGPPEILRDASLWPDQVIVMTLSRVGSGAGPDLDRLGAIVARAEGRAVFAAGGVRGPEDVEALEQAGVAGALVSTALHDGRLSPEVLRRFADRGQ
ncbi:MAG TPA: HisA/HisF-related TIM barrel protein, partial [Aurantimonas sp.]